MSSPARRFGYLAGSAYAVLGLLGSAMTGFDGFAASRGAVLWGLEVNPLHNLLHLVLGLALIVGAARSESEARTLALLTAAAYAVLGLLGLGMVGSSGNLLALNHADNALHLVTAAVAAVAAIASDPAREDTRPHRTTTRA